MAEAKHHNDWIETVVGVPLETLYEWRRRKLGGAGDPRLREMFDIAVRLDDINWVADCLCDHGMDEDAEQLFLRAAARAPFDAMLRVRGNSAHEGAIPYLFQFRHRVWQCLNRLDDRNIGWWRDRLRNAFTQHAYEIVEDLQKTYDPPLPFPQWFIPLLRRESAVALDLEARERSERDLVSLAGRVVQADEDSTKANRVACDAKDMTIRLDEKVIASGVSHEVFEFVRVVAEAHPEPISFSRIKVKASSLNGKNQTRLREAADKFVKCGREPLVISSPTGYLLDLPPLK